MAGATKVDRVLAAARGLTAKQKTEVALRLLDAADPPDPQAGLDDAAWRAEMVRRAEEALSGKGKTYTWEEVRAHVLRKRKRKR